MTEVHLTRRSPVEAAAHLLVAFHNEPAGSPLALPLAIQVIEAIKTADDPPSAPLSSDTPAIDRALSDIAELEEDHGLSSDLAQRARDVVGLLFTPDTCYAVIAPIDDGDLSFYWAAGDRAITINLHAEGGCWQCVRDRHGRTTYEYGGICREMWDHVAAFSAYVQLANPAWRER